ncbi:MAG: hypothetical protein ACQEXJ_01640 [Myxococcota bacterium]
MDPDRARYLRAVEEAFVALRGRGLMLSPRDVALVDAWRERGVPVRVVIRAVEQGAERFAASHPPGTPLPSTLAYFATQVDDAVVLWRERNLAWSADDEQDEAAGDPDADRRRLLDALAEIGRAQDDEAARGVLRRAWRLVKDAAPDEDPWALTPGVEATIVGGLEATLAPAEREALRAEAAAAVEAAGGDAMSEAARAEQLQVEVERRVRARFALPELVEVLGDDDL